MNATSVLEQSWLINLQNVCGEKFEVDANGDLMTPSDGMYIDSIVYYMPVTAILGLYIG